MLTLSETVQYVRYGTLYTTADKSVNQYSCRFFERHWATVLPVNYHTV